MVDGEPVGEEVLELGEFGVAESRVVLGMVSSRGELVATLYAEQFEPAHFAGLVSDGQG